MTKKKKKKKKKKLFAFYVALMGKSVLADCMFFFEVVKHFESQKALCKLPITILLLPLLLLLFFVVVDLMIY